MKKIFKKWWPVQLGLISAAIVLPLVVYTTGYSYVSEAAVWVITGILAFATLAPFKWG